MARVPLTISTLPGTETTVTVAGTTMTADGQSFNHSGGRWFLAIINADVASHTVTIVDQKNGEMTQDDTVTIPASSTVIHAGNPLATAAVGQLIHIDPEVGEHEHINVQAFSFTPSKS